MTDKNDKTTEDICFLCRRPESEMGTLLHFPNMPFAICPDCMQKMMETVENMGLPIGNIDPSKITVQFVQGPMGGTPDGVLDEEPSTEEAPDSSQEEEQQEAGGQAGQQENSGQADQQKTGGQPENQPEPGSAADQTAVENQPEGKPESVPPKKPQKQRNAIPHISMINLGDFMGMMPQQQRIKKKKPEGQEKPQIDLKSVPAPHKIKESLDEYVIGQEHAKKVMSVAVYNHYKRICSDSLDGVEIEKSNMLMIGPTGSGKTYLVKTLAKLLDVPLAIADATSLTEAGYIGDDIESVVSKLLAAADNDVERAEHGIIFVDEIDKIAKKKDAHQRDVSGESVQQGMLKLLEGTEIEVPVGANSKSAMVPMVTVNTKDILFICGGAFPDLTDIIKERLNTHASMGFRADLKDKYDEEENLLNRVTVEDIRKYGMIPEFLGRMPVIFTLETLTEDMLVRILKEPKNAIIKQYQKLLALDEVNLEFTEDALLAIARKAKEKEVGARALRSVIEEFMLDIMYEIPKDDNIGTVTITKEYVEKTGGPRIAMRTVEQLEG